MFVSQSPALSIAWICMEEPLRKMCLAVCAVVAVANEGDEGNEGNEGQEGNEGNEGNEGDDEPEPAKPEKQMPVKEYPKYKVCVTKDKQHFGVGPANKYNNAPKPQPDGLFVSLDGTCEYVSAQILSLLLP
jgi:hypothetical protein